MGIIQKTSGVNSATFAAPTQLNSNIVVMASVHDGSGFISCSDDQGQSYVDTSGNSQNGNIGTFWFAKSYSVAGVTTVTVVTSLGDPLDLSGTAQVWAYELQQPVDGSGPFGPFPSDTMIDGTDDNNGNSSTPTGSGIFNDDDFGTQHVYFTLCAVSPGTVVSTDSPWTLDTIRDGDAVAYLDDSTGDLTAGFTLDGARNFAIQEVSFYTAPAPILECCPPAIPPDGPFDDFTEQDIFTFFPGNTLRASTLDKLNKNILEATLSPEFFAPAIYHDGDIVPLPVSAVDSYAYTRPELSYLWSWNNTGPESEIRLPTFSGFVYTDTAGGHVPGQVHIEVWRLPAGHPPLETHDGSLRVIVIGSRQAQHPEVLDDGSNPPDDGGNPADSLSGSLVFTDLAAALPPTVLETIPAGRSGIVQITYTAKITRVASTSSVLGGTSGAQVSYADANDLQEVQTAPGPTDAGNLLTTTVNGQINVNAAENNDVIFQFDYTSVGATAMTYTLNIAWQAV